MQKSTPQMADSVLHDALGCTQPSRQEDWRDDTYWMEFASANLIGENYIFHLEGGLDWSVEDADAMDVKPDPEVVVAFLNASDGVHGHFNLPAAEARELARELLIAADIAEHETRRRRTNRRTAFDKMEARRTEFHNEDRD